MSPIEPLNLDTIRMSNYIYFAGTLTVIVLASLGTVALVLGILKMHVLKPYLNKYPFEEYKSFEEFAHKQPAAADGGASDDPREILRKKEERMRNEPSLTWDNVADNIACLSAQEFKKIRENHENEDSEIRQQQEALKDW
jgi:hypothetical protein